MTTWTDPACGTRTGGLLRPRVVVVHYGMGNVDSVARAIEHCGGSAMVSGRSEDFEEATHVILPGVGAFPAGMENIRRLGVDELLVEHVLRRRKPLLGICLGMQLLADEGHEGSETSGLGFIRGDAKRLHPSSPSERLPHIGWNEVILTRDSRLFRGLPSNRDFYFVHSYHLDPSDRNDVIGTTAYANGFVSAIERANIFGVQFHPEKSQRVGFQVLQNFMAV